MPGEPDRSADSPGVEILYSGEPDTNADSPGIELQYSGEPDTSADSPGIKDDTIDSPIRSVPQF